MHMRVVCHCRAPSVEHRDDADPSAKMFGIGGDGEQGFGSGFEQKIIDHRFVLIGDVGDQRRQGEDDVIIGHR